jgi:hypothetical protein
MTAPVPPKEDAETVDIENDDSLSPIEKARRKQALLNERILRALEAETAEEVCPIHRNSVVL